MWPYSHAVRMFALVASTHKDLPATTLQSVPIDHRPPLGKLSDLAMPLCATSRAALQLAHRKTSKSSKGRNRRQSSQTQVGGAIPTSARGVAPTGIRSWGTI